STTIGGQPASEQAGAAAGSVYEEASAGASGSSRPDGPAAIVSALRDCRELFGRRAAMIAEAQRLCTLARQGAASMGNDGVNAPELLRLVAELEAHSARAAGNEPSLPGIIRRVEGSLDRQTQGGAPLTRHEKNELLTLMEESYQRAANDYMELHELTYTLQEQLRTNRQWLSPGE